MTPDELIEKVAQELRQNQCITKTVEDQARAAIRVVLEEAASAKFLRPLVEKQAMGEWYDETIDEDVAAFASAIRAMMPREG